MPGRGLLVYRGTPASESTFSRFRRPGCSPITIKTSPSSTSVPAGGLNIILPSGFLIASTITPPSRPARSSSLREAKLRPVQHVKLLHRHIQSRRLAGKIEKLHNVRPKQRLRESMPGHAERREDNVRSSPA